jgi:hypothetical protein
MKYINYTLCILGFAASSLSAQAPTSGAGTPSFNSSNVISLFSNAYTNKNVDTWRTPWSSATLKDTSISGDDMKRYSALDFVGIEATGSNMLDLSSMNYVHVDFWTSNATIFRVKLVNWGADKSYGGGDDSEHEVVFTSPTQSTWNQWHIPMSSFSGLSGKGAIAQIILSAQPTGSAEVYVDNILFTTEAQSNAPQAPSAGAVTPTVEAASVVSIFSNAYTNKAVDTWRTPWSNATFADTTIGSDDMKRYTKLDFVGIEATGANLIDASAMQYVHIDFWTPNATTFRIKLVDWGADKAYGGGDDKEHEIASTTHASGEWISWHLPLSSFTTLTNRSSIAQVIFSAQPTGSATVFIDNFFFTTENSKNPLYGPKTAAAAPTLPANQVVSLFSDVYPDKKVDTWRTPWSNATWNDTIIASDTMKHYSKLDFVGIEATGANSIDASGMTHINVDFWTVNATTFRIKLVDWGADGAYGGGDDSEHEIVSSTHGLKQWNNWKIALADFTGLKGKSKISQIIFSALPTASADVYLDNIYFSTSSSAVNTPAEAKVSVYPNPSMGVLNITSEVALEQVQVFDATGRLVASALSNALSVSLDIAALQSGSYQVVTTTQAGKATTALLVP